MDVQRSCKERLKKSEALSNFSGVSKRCPEEIPLDKSPVAEVGIESQNPI
jgi:hypothetical protein